MSWDYCGKRLEQEEKVLVVAGNILSLSTDHSRFSSVSLPSIGQGRPLRPLITSQHLHLTVSREEDLLCSRPQAGGINGLMTLILSRAGAIRSLAARWIDQVCPSESKRFVYKSSRFCPDFMRFLSGFHAYSVRIHRECCPNRNRILSALHAAVVRSRIERCPFFVRL